MDNYVRFVVLGGTSTTLTSGIYTNPEVYSGNGAAGSVFFGGTLSGNNVAFEGNSSTQYGGAVYAIGEIDFTGSTFSGNAADFHGGALYCNNAASVSISGNVFQNNTAASYGGALFTNGTTILDGVSFRGNTAAFGGAIYNSTGGNLTVCDAIFTDNSASRNFSGAIYNKGTLTFTGTSEFSGNVTGGTAGAIYNHKAGTVKVAGVVNLQTSDDTWVNAGNIFWVLTGVNPGSSVCINNFTNFIDNGGSKFITVAAAQTIGEYVIATNIGSHTADSFTLTGIGSTTATITTDGETVSYGGRYQLSTQIVSDGTASYQNLVLTRLGQVTVNSDGTEDYTSIADAIKDGYTQIAVVGGTYGNGTASVVFSAENTELMVLNDTIYNAKAMLCGGTETSVDVTTERYRTVRYCNGDCNVSIMDGTYQSNVIGADVCSSGSLEHYGDVTLKISGGTFNKQVAGGVYYRTTGRTGGTDVTGKTYTVSQNMLLNNVCLEGNVAMTISGGTFNAYVYGGNFSSTDSYGANALLDGNVTLTIDASCNKIYFASHVIAGSRGTGVITGDVTVVMRGNADNLTFDDGKYLSGGCLGDVYRTSTEGEESVREVVSSVIGDRKLLCEDFHGEFTGNLFMFNSIEFGGDTKMSFSASQKVNLGDIKNWELNWDTNENTYADLSNVRNTFETDTVSIDFSRIEELSSAEDVLLIGSANSFDTLFDGSAAGVNFVSGDTKLTATLDNARWLASDANYNYTLALDEETHTKLSVSKSAKIA